MTIKKKFSINNAPIIIECFFLHTFVCFYAFFLYSFILFYTFYQFLIYQYLYFAQHWSQKNACSKKHEKKHEKSIKSIKKHKKTWVREHTKKHEFMVCCILCFLLSCFYTFGSLCDFFT